MAIQHSLWHFLIFFSLISPSIAISSRAISNAVEVLSNSGFNSMALTLDFGFRSIIPQTTNLTIFSPPDAAFAKYGQPSLSLLQFHFSPGSLTPGSLKSLTSGSEISTFSGDRSITVTSSQYDDRISLNSVKISDLPVYDDGHLTVYGTEKFFDPNFTLPGETRHRGTTLACEAVDFYGNNTFYDASQVLRSKGFSAAATFLDLQLAGTKDQTPLTVFAPPDSSLASVNFTDYPLIFLRHVVPCKISGRDLAYMDREMVVNAYLVAYDITIAKSIDYFLVNGVQVEFMDLYQNSWLAVHGLRRSFSSTDFPQIAGAESSVFNTILMTISGIFLSFIFW